MSTPEPPLPPAIDLVVVGAGVNGTAIAREAALHGVRTLLLDATDLAAGTSSASSRMIHGGPRYLEHLELRLVRESLRERERLLTTARHLVTPYALLIPFYEHNRRKDATLRAGMLAYDILSFDKTSPRHEPLSAHALADRYPGLSRTGMHGGIIYHDAHTPYPERLAVEQAVDVAALGGAVRTHCRVTGLSPRSGSIEVSVHDEVTGQDHRIQATVVVNAAGPWVDQVLGLDSSRRHERLIGGTKGSHLTVPAFPGAPATGVHYEARSDGRAILVLPQADGRYLIGATDIFVDGDPGEVVCTDEEIDYLLAEVNHLVPAARLTPADVLHSYSGVRPLPYSPHARSAAEVSRDHQIVAHAETPGLYSVTGGKLTTHRALGALALRRISGDLGIAPWGRARLLSTGRVQSLTRNLPLPGARCADWSAFRRAFTTEELLPPAAAKRLLSLYGVRAGVVTALAREDSSLAEVIPGTDDVLAAEVVVALQTEFARTLTDVMARRLMLSRRDDVGLGCAAAVAAVCARAAGWDSDRTREETARYRRWTRRLRPKSLRMETEADLLSGKC